MSIALCDECESALRVLVTPGETRPMLMHYCPACRLTVQIFIDAERDNGTASAEPAAPASPSCVEAA